MILLDPDMKGCIVWLINSSINGYKSNVTYIKGDIPEVCESLRKRLAGYKIVKNEWGNYVKELIWLDEVYLDIAAMGYMYKDILFKKYGLPIKEVVGKSRNVIPERQESNLDMENMEDII